MFHFMFYYVYSALSGPANLRAHSIKQEPTELGLAKKGNLHETREQAPEVGARVLSTGNEGRVRKEQVKKGEPEMKKEDRREGIETSSVK